MKTTEHFKEIIRLHLEKRAAADPLFAEKFNNSAKNIDDCITYILNWVRESGCEGFTDEEIYGQAIHYYDEDNIEVGKPINCNVVVNHAVELTEEEKRQAKEATIQKAQDEAYKHLIKKEKPKKESNKVEQPSLF